MKKTYLITSERNGEYYPVGTKMTFEYQLDKDLYFRLERPDGTVVIDSCSEHHLENAIRSGIVWENKVLEDMYFAKSREIAVCTR